MSAEMMASVLLRLAAMPVRRLMSERSDEKSLANSASWLAGRAWSPLGNGHTNLNSTGLQTSCDIPLTLNSLEHRYGILDSFLYRNLHHAQMLEALAFFDLNIHREYGNFGLTNFAILQFVFNSHGALGLDFDLVSQCLGGFLQLLGSHIRMSDARRTCGYSNDLHAAFSMVLVRFSASVFTTLMDRAVTAAPDRMATT